jgi:hypothetical protein
LMSGWRREDSSIWQRNRKSIEGYEYIDTDNNNS